VKLHIITRKKYTGINRASNLLRKLHQVNKTYIPSYLPGHGEFKNLCFISVAQTVWVSHVFVYGMVDLDKIMTIFLVKPLSYICTQLSKLQKNYSLLHLSITGEHFKPNPKQCRVIQMKVMAVNVSTYNLFSAYSCCTNRFFLFNLLSCALITKLLTRI